MATRTRFGRYVFAIGGNPEAAELSGVNTRRTLMKVFGLMGVLCGIAACISTARLNAATNAAGTLDENQTELLLGHLKGSGKSILTEPDVLLTETSKLPGLDGDKMAKSRNNSIAMRDEPAAVTQKVRGMKTDPARARRTDPGTPEKCPVWEFHKVYTDADTRAWVQQGCTTAGIGCLDCKQPVIDAIIREQQPWRERAEAYLANPKQVHWIVEMGTERARTVARQTMKDVREAMGLNY
jgi:tryptophanyl-tRNA synthetase